MNENKPTLLDVINAHLAKQQIKERQSDEQTSWRNCSFILFAFAVFLIATSIVILSIGR